MRRLAVPAVHCLIAAALFSGCASKTARGPQKASVTVALAERRDVPYELRATGSVEAVRSADVVPLVAGTVVRMMFREGDEVGAGQALIGIDPQPYRARALAGSAAVARSRAQAQAARLDFDRTRALYQQQLVARGEYDLKEAAYAVAAATAAGDSAALANALLDVANTTVRAPIGGRTGDARVHQGDVVRAGDPTAPIVSIRQLRPIRVRFTLPERERAAVLARRGHRPPVYARAAGVDSTWAEGVLSFVDNAIDPGSGTVLLKGEFANGNSRLWPGQFVDVRLELGRDAAATVVPASAVTDTQTGQVVFVLAPDSTAAARPVQVSRQWNGWAVVTSGVQPGETVLTDGQARLGPGARVVVRVPAPAGGKR